MNNELAKITIDASNYISYLRKEHNIGKRIHDEARRKRGGVCDCCGFFTKHSDEQLATAQMSFALILVSMIPYANLMQGGMKMNVPKQLGIGFENLFTFLSHTILEEHERKYGASDDSNFFDSMKVINDE